jgi:hypothetical protein
LNPSSGDFGQPEQHDRHDPGEPSQRIAPLMTRGPMTETQARVAANALVFGYFGALEQWYLDGGVHPISVAWSGRYLE